MGDAGRLEVTDGLAVEDDADLVVDDFDDEGLPFANLDVSGERGGATNEELGDFSLLGRVVLHRVDVIAHAAVLFVDDLYGALLGLGVITDLGAADVAVVATGEVTVVEFDVDHRGAVELDAAFHDGVLVRDFEAVDGGVGGDDSLAILGRLGLHAGLGAEEGAIGDLEGIDHADPALVRGAGEIIGEEQLALLGDGFGRDRRELRSVGRESGGEEEEGEEGFHGERQNTGAKVQKCKGEFA